MTQSDSDAQSLPPLSGEDAYCKSATMLVLCQSPLIMPRRSPLVKRIPHQFGRNAKKTSAGGFAPSPYLAEKRRPPQRTQRAQSKNDNRRIKCRISRCSRLLSRISLCPLCSLWWFSRFAEPVATERLPLDREVRQSNYRLLPTEVPYAYFVLPSALTTSELKVCSQNKLSSVARHYGIVMRALSVPTNATVTPAPRNSSVRAGSTVTPSSTTTPPGCSTIVQRSS